jgi:hypothetical protein
MATRQRDFWTGWLTVVVAGTLLFGLAMVAMPGVTRAGFNLMLYGATAGDADFGPEALRYVNLAHAVMGAVMAGWSAVLLWVVRGPLRRGEAGAWAAVAGSVAAWFSPTPLHRCGTGSGRTRCSTVHSRCCMRCRCGRTEAAFRGKAAARRRRLHGAASPTHGGNNVAMKTTIDAAGRLVIPKKIRE